MPLYEYQCHSCDTKFEKMVSFSAVYLNPECPHCHNSDTRKLISSFATGGSSPSGTIGTTGSCSSTGRFT